MWAILMFGHFSFGYFFSGHFTSFPNKTLRDVLIHVGIKLNFHFAHCEPFSRVDNICDTHSKCKPFFHPSSLTAACLYLHWMIPETHAKRQNANFSELGIRGLRERGKKLKILFYPNFVFYLFFQYNFLLPLNARTGGEGKMCF